MSLLEHCYPKNKSDIDLADTAGKKENFSFDDVKKKRKRKRTFFLIDLY